MRFLFVVLQFTVSFVNFTELGVLSWRLDADNYENDEELKKIREERGYSYMVIELAFNVNMGLCVFYRYCF